MSTKVAVVCEDPTYDRYIVKPVVTALLAEIGRPRAVVQMIDSPTHRGESEVLAHACEFVDRWRQQADALVFILDQDCEDGTEGRRNKLQRLKNAIGRCEDADESVIAAVAIQEVEVWAVWGSRFELGGVAWPQVIAECHPKERFFEPLLRPADALLADGGRSRLIAKSLASGWQSIRTGCVELQRLEDHLKSSLGLAT